jgi:predicted dithiol-disulfide oxidoreductase (DUF899 family)
MALPDVVSRDEWRKARIELLAEEKALTRARDALSTRRRELPMVRIDKDYRFEGPAGPAGLLDMFEGRSQLVMQHFMFDPSWEDGCPSCTAAADEISDGLLRHLHSRDTTLVLVSRAPLERLERYKAERGWDMPWYSSFGSDFNYDFHVSLDPARGPIEFNYRGPDELREAGAGWLLDGPTEQPGHSAFLAVDGAVFHTYSSFARGGEWFGGSYAFLDVTALGRQEEWEKPEGRADSVRRAVPDFAS